MSKPSPFGAFEFAVTLYTVDVFGSPFDTAVQVRLSPSRTATRSADAQSTLTSPAWRWISSLMRGTSRMPRVTFQLTFPPPLVCTTATVIGTPLAAPPWHSNRSPFFTLRLDGHESLVMVTPPDLSFRVI